jgi:hypothetical protein
LFDKDITMIEKNTTTNATDLDSRSSIYENEVSPDTLMNDFRGKPIVGIVALTLIIHAVLIGVFSIGYIKETFLGEDTSNLSKEERLNVAVREATILLREICERHDLSPQELSNRFADGGGKLNTTTGASGSGSNAATNKTGGDANKTGSPNTPNTSGVPKTPGSNIEKTLNQKAAGPDVPDLNAKEDDDLFKTSE